MSYLYDNLKIALGGEKVMASKSTIIKGWSPNSLKALIITRSYILVSHHLGFVKVYPLDMELVTKDLSDIAQAHSMRPKLNGLLTRRRFSCLEEIYVDSAFINYPGVIDLLGYVSDLTKVVTSDTSNASRLRYFGYGDFPYGSGDTLADLMRKKQRELGYSLAFDPSRMFVKLEFKTVDNPEWYTRYNLRSANYGPDADKGDLSVYLRKVESAYTSKLKKEATEEENKFPLGDFAYIVKELDFVCVPVLQRIDATLKSLVAKKSDDICEHVLKCISTVVNSYTKGDINGDIVKLVKTSLQGVSDKEIEYLLTCYKRYGVFKSKEDVSKEKVQELKESNKGFLDINSFLDNVCLNVTEDLIKHGHKELTGISLLMCGSSIPDGAFNKKYVRKVSPGASEQGYFSYLGDIVGFKI